MSAYRYSLVCSLGCLSLTRLPPSPLLFVDNSEQIIAQAAFLSIPEALLVTVVKRDTLACSEIALFERCVAWAKATTKSDDSKQLQAKLKDVLPHIRFTTSEQSASTFPLLTCNLSHALSWDVM